jgi:hypothetical protein
LTTIAIERRSYLKIRRLEVGVVYIGDRAVGKTHLAMELANPHNDYVKVSSPDYENLKRLLFDEDLGRTKATDAQNPVDERYLEIQIRLPTGLKKVAVDWVDTPGEIWRKTWQTDRPDQWNNFLEAASKSEGILLILSPYREMLKSSVNSEEFMTQQQWCNRFDRWVEFFRRDCPKVKHLTLCLNKADLFCDIAQEARQLAYQPHGSSMNWQQRHSYVFNRYFRAVHPQIEQINRSISGLSVRCFITSIYNRSLLELPWIYLGSFLAK